MEPARLLLHPLAGPLKGVRWKAAEIAARSHSPPLSKLHSLASILLSLAPSTPTFFPSFSASHTLPTLHTHAFILTHIHTQTHPGCRPPACRLWLSCWNQDAGPPPWFVLTPPLFTHLHPGSGLSPLQHHLGWCQSDTPSHSFPVLHLSWAGDWKEGARTAAVNTLILEVPSMLFINIPFSPSMLSRVSCS